MNDLCRKLGDNINKRRKELKLSLQDVAERTQATKSWIWELEKGKSTNPSFIFIVKLSKALETTVSNLTGEEIFSPGFTEKEIELVNAHRRIYGVEP